MKPDPIIDEVWRVKDELSARHGFDVGKICEDLREKEANWHGKNPLLHSPAELRVISTGGEKFNAADAVKIAREEHA